MIPTANSGAALKVGRIVSILQHLKRRTETVLPTNSTNR